MIPLTQKIGDNKTYRIPLIWEGRPFRATSDWILTFTLKADPDTETDENALIQKMTGAGILNAFEDALVSIVPIDTRGDAEADPVVLAIDPGSYYWGILAQHIDTGERRHVQDGKLKLEQAITRDDEIAVPIHTTNPPGYPIGGSVLYDTAQTLTDPQKAQARTNIGLGSAALSDETDFAPALGADDNYVTDAEKIVIGNTSGTNTGDQDLSGYALSSSLAPVATSGDYDDLDNLPTLGTAAASNTTDFATAAQGTLADSSLQPTAVDYRGEYDNGDGTYGIGAVVLYNELLYQKISNPNNAGYPPSGADWELFEPLIGSPAYDLWAQTLLASKADNQDLADYLPLAGGTMDDNAAILWDNASAIREAGAQGLELECSVGYRWQWVSGRMIMRQVNSGQIARIIAIDGINPSATDDETQGFVIGTRWETVDGIVYVCTDATTNAAVWVAADILASDLTSSIDATNRQLLANDGSTIMLDWSNTYQLNIPEGMPLGVDIIYDAGTPLNYISLVGGQLGGYSGSNVMSLDWYNRQLYAPDGTTVIARWSNSTYFEANQIYGIDTSIGIDLTNSGLLDQGNKMLDWYARTLNDAAGNPIAKWGEDFSSGNYGIAFAPDGMGGFYHLLNADGLNFLSSSRYGSNTIDYNGVTSIDVQNRQLLDSSNTTSVDWGSSFLYGAGSLSSIDWYLRQLIASDGSTIAADWSTGIPVVPSATLTPNTVAALTGGEGTIAYVNDADTPVVGSAVVGGASAKCLVCYNGTDWIVTSLL